MPADNIAYSADGRHYLYYWDVEGGSQIRLFQSGTDRTLLDLTDDSIVITLWRFDPASPLLRLLLSRPDRSIVNYPANIDLDTGLFYNHPIPRQAHAPAGVAADIIPFFANGMNPAPIDPGNLPAPWILEGERDPLGKLTPKSAPPPEPAPEPVLRAPTPEPPPEPQIAPREDSRFSFTGHWRIDEVPSLLHPGRTAVQVVHVSDGKVVIDTTSIDADAAASFQPKSFVIDLTLTRAGEPTRHYAVDLYGGVFWNAVDNGSGTVTGYPFSALAEVLADGEPADPSVAWAITRRSQIDKLRSAKAQPATALQFPRPPMTVADATVAAKVAAFSAAAHEADLPIHLVRGVAFAAAVAAGVLTPEEAIETLKGIYPHEPFWK